MDRAATAARSGVSAHGQSGLNPGRRYPYPGVGRMGIAGAGSGDLFLAFSTARPKAADSLGVTAVPMLQDERIDPVYALPHDRLKAALQKYNRLRSEK